MPAVAIKISARYSPTCVVKFDSMEISTVKIVSPSRHTFTSCVSGSTTSIPPKALTCSGMMSIHAMAPTQPTHVTIAPMMKRSRISSPRIEIRSTANATSAAATTMVSGAASSSSLR